MLYCRIFPAGTGSVNLKLIAVMNLILLFGVFYIIIICCKSVTSDKFRPGAVSPDICPAG